MSMAARYRTFRSYGHGRIISAMNAPDILVVLTASMIVGLCLGLAL